MPVLVHLGQRRRRGRVRDVGDEPAGRAHRPAADRLAAVAEVDGVDLHLVPAGVERGTGGELAQRQGGVAAVGEVLGLVAPGVGVEPGETDVEGDRVVEEGVVGEDARLLQHGDPVLPLQASPLLLRQPQRGLGVAVGVLVVLSSDGQLGEALEVGDLRLDRGDPVTEGLDLLPPLLRRQEQALGQWAGELDGRRCG